MIFRGLQTLIWTNFSNWSTSPALDSCRDVARQMQVLKLLHFFRLWMGSFPHWPSLHSYSQSETHCWACWAMFCHSSCRSFPHFAVNQGALSQAEFIDGLMRMTPAPASKRELLEVQHDLHRMWTLGISISWPCGVTRPFWHFHISWIQIRPPDPSWSLAFHAQGSCCHSGTCFQLGKSAFRTASLLFEALNFDFTIDLPLPQTRSQEQLTSFMKDLPVRLLPIVEEVGVRLFCFWCVAWRPQSPLVLPLSSTT